MPTPIDRDALDRALAVPDLTDPSQGPHALKLLVDVATAALRQRWGCEVVVARGPRVVPVADNYDRLNFTADAASRDARYTRYVDDTHMLRSHTSAMVPPALRALGEHGDQDDVLLVCPGIVHRRDAIDRLHTGTPHQLDLWRITRRPCTLDDLGDMCAALIGALVPGATWRWEPRVHPYTLDGRQVDVVAGGEWVEVWECGLAHPEVLARAGLDGWSGLALGMGLDRLLMLRKAIPDIRLLRSSDRRVVEQMLDLEPYRPVSSMPPVRRDLSIAVAADDTAEDLGDRVRDALGDDADSVEEVAILSEAAYADLPAGAVARMGMTPDQKNLVVRVVLRKLERTLTSAEANDLRDRIYAALHAGARHEWAGDH